MSDDTPSFYDTREEYCPDCETEQNHHITIEVKTESEQYGGNQPYRIKECQVCGNEEHERVGMGD